MSVKSSCPLHALSFLRMYTDRKHRGKKKKTLLCVCLGIKESYSSTLWFSLDQTLCPALHLKWTPTKRKSYAWSQQMASVSSKKLSKCLKQGRDSLDTGSGKLGLSIKTRDELSVSACKFRQGKHSNLYNGQQKVFLYLWLLSDCRTRQKPALTYCHQIKLLLWTCTSKHGAT